MQRGLAIAALGAAFLMLSISAWGQRGGGGHGGGGGFSGHAGGIGGHAGFASHSGFAPRTSVPVGRSGGPIITNGWYGNGWGNGWRYPYNGYWRGYPYYPYYPYRGYYGWGYGGGWWGYPYWGLGWGWGSDDSYPAQTTNNYYQYPQYPPPDAYGSGYQSSDQSDQQQAEIDRLNDEVTRLREDRQLQNVPKPGAKPGEETELVFRDKHTEKIQNYAIVGQTLWVLSELRSRKVPLADLDIAATQQANEARGIDFELPR
jgi:hypothetical protein